ncbi:hypothetical protein ACFE04_016576 [Oxalis oulophora]
MWRQKFYKGNNDESDQSISDDEDSNFDFPQICVSRSEQQEGLRLQSKLEILKGAYGLDREGKAANISHDTFVTTLFYNQMHTDIAVEDDEVQVPDSLSDTTCSPSKAFPDNSDDELISDHEQNNAITITSAAVGRVYKRDLNSHGYQKQDGASIWSEISKQTEALVHLNEKPSCSSSHSGYSKSHKGIKGKAKSKLSFRFQTHKEGQFCSDILKEKNDALSDAPDMPESLEAIDSTEEILEDYDGMGILPSEGYGFIEHSIAERLDSLQDQISLANRNSNVCCRKRGKKPIIRRNVVTLGDRTLGSEDFPEPGAYQSSSDEEASHQALVLAIPEMKKPTISDRFQEALGAASLGDEGSLVAANKPSSLGLFGRLQQIMLTQKERDVVFLSNLQSETCSANKSCLNVKIISRCLDAKLSVCQCSLTSSIESPQWPEVPHKERKRTIIFHPGVCGDVDLEVGSLICIHPPWKDVQVINCDENILLSLVGGGPEPQYPPNKVMIWDDHQSRCIGELSFRSEVRSVKLRRDRIVVVLEQKIFVYNFGDLKLLHQIETIANPKGLCAVSHGSGSMVLVCPGLQKGQVRVEHYASKRTKFIMAHDSRIACFALTQDGQILATASTKGTLVRIYNTLDGTLLQEVRRGADRAEIHSLAFSATAQWLAVSSDKGTVHVFGLKVNSGATRPESPKTASDPNSPSSSLSFMKGVLPKYFSSEWSVAQFHLVEGSQYTVAFGHQKNTVVILGMDGSFYRCQFDPMTGGEMTQLEYHNFVKPEATF